MAAMQNLIRRLRGEGETYGVSLDGAEVGAVSVRRLSGDRTRVDLVRNISSRAWLTAGKDLTFVLRHIQIPIDFKGDLGNYTRAYASEIFPKKDEEIFVRTDGIQDPDGVVFVHGIYETRQRELFKDFAKAGIDPRKAAGLVPQAVAIHSAVELLERRTLPKFLVILHLGQTAVDLVGVRGGRPVFYRSHTRREPTGSANAPSDKSEPIFIQQISGTVNYLENNPHFGTPQEVVLTGLWSNVASVAEAAGMFFPKSQVRVLQPADTIVSESMSPEDFRSHALSIGAAAVGMRQALAGRINFLDEPMTAAEKRMTDTVYDKIILGCAAAMLALAFVTVNAFFLDSTKSHLSKIAENQKTIETLRAELHCLEPDLESATRLLNAAAVRLDASKSKTFSIPASAAKLISAVESAAPDGITLDKIESGAATSSQGGYSNLSYQGDPATVAISGKATLPEQVILFQDALREALGVYVDIASMGREGDFWSRKPVNFVIVLRGAIRRA